MAMKCTCGEIFRQKEDGSFDKYCPACGKPNPIVVHEIRRKEEEAIRRQKEAVEKHQEWIRSLQEGDIIELGSYPYETAGTKKSVEWRILEKKADGMALLISKYALDTRRFDLTSNDWERSEIRPWLNNEFYNTTFNEAEKESMVENRDTGSKVFLLSEEEAGKYFRYNDMKAWPTSYAKERGAYTDDSGDGSCCWWLRSLGSRQVRIASVSYKGNVDSWGQNLFYVYNAVRPALKVNLNNL